MPLSRVPLRKVSDRIIARLFCRFTGPNPSLPPCLLGTVSQDIKPENVLLASDPFDGKRVAVFLADFGVSMMGPDLQNMMLGLYLASCVPDECSV